MMRPTIKRATLKTLLGVFIMCLFYMQGPAKIIANATEKGFAGPGSEDIRLHVMEAAGYFLKSQSDMLLFLNKIELEEINGVDYTELQPIINSAVWNMQNAKATYHALTQIADSSPYNQAVITNLINFDYAFFRESKELNGVITNQVQNYLSGGDIRGLYQELLADSQAILDMLNRVKSTVDAYGVPGTPDLWQINHSYSQTLLFGQYAAEIFYDITGK
ncbi:MAG: hypothetical protein JSV88_15005 [Candidatus Aminicenantes bacterium]|nr:MAG: hypothetical protein JSV88_15005 [Candidatus Aminicenantes bacterium]